MVPIIVRKSYCRDCHQELGDWHTGDCATKKSGVDYRDVITYRFRLIGKA